MEPNLYTRSILVKAQQAQRLREAQQDRVARRARRSAGRTSTDRAIATGHFGWLRHLTGIVTGAVA